MADHSRVTRLANLTLTADPEYLRGRRAWTTPRPGTIEGIPATGFGTRPVLGDPPVRDFSAARPWLERAPQHFGREDWVALVTEADDPVAWVAAGQATAGVLLAAAGAGLSASFMTQALEVPTLRNETRR